MNTITFKAFKKERTMEVPAISNLRFKWQQEEAQAEFDSIKRRGLAEENLKYLINNAGQNYLTAPRGITSVRLAEAHLSAYVEYTKYLGGDHE